MTHQRFFNAVTTGGEDAIRRFIQALEAESATWCVIGGLAVNAYAEPVVSLDLDAVVVVPDFASLVDRLRADFTVREFANSVNLEFTGSALRIQIQTDARYRPFVERASLRPVLGYDLPVAAIEDVLQGKVWAATDPTRRPSKRQKDLADLLRLLEVEPRLAALIPAPLRSRLVAEGR